MNAVLFSLSASVSWGVLLPEGHERFTNTMQPVIAPWTPSAVQILAREANSTRMAKKVNGTLSLAAPRHAQAVLPWDQGKPDDAPAPEPCKDMDECAQAKTMLDMCWMTGICCDTTIMEIAKAFDQESAVPADIGDSQVKEMCPVTCDFCSTPVKGTAIFSLAMPTDDAGIADFSAKLIKQFCYFSRRYDDLDTCMKVLSVKEGSIVAEIEMQPNADAEPPFLSMYRLADKLKIGNADNTPGWADSFGSSVTNMTVTRQGIDPNAMDPKTQITIMCSVVVALLLCCCGTCIYCCCCRKKKGEAEAVPADPQA